MLKGFVIRPGAPLGAGKAYAAPPQPGMQRPLGQAAIHFVVPEAMAPGAQGVGALGQRQPGQAPVLGDNQVTPLRPVDDGHVSRLRFRAYHDVVFAIDVVAKGGDGNDLDAGPGAEPADDGQDRAGVGIYQYAHVITHGQYTIRCAKLPYVRQTDQSLDLGAERKRESTAEGFCRFAGGLGAGGGTGGGEETSSGRRTCTSRATTLAS